MVPDVVDSDILRVKKLIVELNSYEGYESQFRHGGPTPAGLHLFDSWSLRGTASCST